MALGKGVVTFGNPVGQELIKGRYRKKLQYNLRGCFGTNLNF